MGREAGRKDFVRIPAVLFSFFWGGGTVTFILYRARGPLKVEDYAKRQFVRLGVEDND